jgi:hypothetical protein
LAWSPYGGKDGMLIVSGHRVVTGQEGKLEVTKQSGRVLMVNGILGVGPWREIDAPFVVDPTGGYGPGETACPGYSSPVLAPTEASDPSFIFLSGTAVANGKCEIRYGIGKLGHAP